jgi:hypothetical protein
LRDWRSPVGANVSGIAQLKFRLPASSFGVITARTNDFAAVQCCWRDFRMPQ